MERFLLAIVAGISFIGCQPSAGHPSTASATPSHVDLPFDGSTEGALTESTARLFREKAPNLSVAVVGPLTLAVDVVGGSKHDLRVSLDRMWNHCQSDPANCERVVRDFVAKVAVTIATAEQPLTREQVMAAVRPRAYFDSLPADARANLEPFAGDLCVSYVADSPHATRSLGESDLQSLHLTRESLAILARANLGRRLGRAIDALDTARPGDVVALNTSDYFESSLLLLTDAWAALYSKVQRPLFAAAPANDVLLVAIDPSADQVQKLRYAARTIFAKADRPVSHALFRWDAGRWVVAQ